MYSINGHPLDNDELGWSMLRRSQPLTPVAKNLSSVTVPGRHGVLSGIPSFKTASMVTLVIRTPGEWLEALYALFELNGGTGLLELTEDPSRTIQFELVSIDPQGINAEDELVNVTVTLRFPTGAWRHSTQVDTGSITVDSPVFHWDVFAGMTADITDMDVFITGPFGDFYLQDEGSGSWIRNVQAIPIVPNTGLLYVGATGQVFRAANANPWAPSTDISQMVEASGGGGFRISPVILASPKWPSGRLILTTTNSSGVSIRMRGRNAYALRNGGI